ncbi:MAG TPA: hypothetical protein DCE18_02165, partial [Syntrophobacteraceae bacterium]|nr:hypothetical protein [Syntrophobacteraceae bacterium]
MFHNRLIPLLVLVTALLWSPPSMLASTPTLERDVAYFAGLNDRSMGSTGADQAAEYIFKQFTEAGLSSVGTQKFLHPVPEASAASLQVDGVSMRLFPWGPNMAYLPMTPEEGLTGSLVYVGDGNLENFQGHAIHGAIVVMNSGTGGNWMNAAMLGASALIYLGDRDSTRNEYQQQNIPTPVAFPRFWISSEGGQRLQALAAKRDLAVTVTARTRWQNKLVRNVYGLIPGKSEKLKEELIILEAFYDASSPVLGLAPGADEAVSIGALLTLARHLGENPPERSVLLVATTGNAQGLAGMREFTWAATTRKKAMRDQERRLDIRKKEVDHLLDLLKEAQPLDLADKADRGLIWQLVVNRARDKADELGRETQIQRLLRGSALQESAVPKTDPETEKIETDAETSDKDRRANDFEPDANVDPRDYRRLASLNSSEALTGNQRQLAEGLLRGARRDLKAERDELKLRLQSIKSSQQLRTLLGDFTSVLVMGLHLSSHSLAVGLTEMGNTYPWREEIKRRVRSFRLNEILTQLAGEIPRHSDIPGIIFASLATHGSGGKAPNHFCNSCDAAAIADLPAVSLSTLEDNRA